MSAGGTSTAGALPYILIEELWTGPILCGNSSTEAMQKIDLGDQVEASVLGGSPKRGTKV